MKIFHIKFLYSKKKFNHIFDIYVTHGIEKQKVLLVSSTEWIEYNEKKIFSVNIQDFSLDKSSSHPLIFFGRFFENAKQATSPILRNLFLS